MGPTPGVPDGATSPADAMADDVPAIARALLRGTPDRADRLCHLEVLPARAAEISPWPAWVDPAVVTALTNAGVASPWRHQVEAADAAWAGEHVVLATSAASGKSLGYLLPALTAVRQGSQASTGRGATVLYLAPTKALAADQLAALTALDVPGVRAATLDGDTAPEERRWVRDHAAYVLTNPDLLHHSLLPGHERWASFLRHLHFVVVDECHAYRGVFGSHVAAVLRRLRRVAARYGASPTFVLASATVSAPEEAAARLTGLPVRAVTRDASPRGRTAFALWEPPLLPFGGEHGAPTRRTATAETADLLTDLVAAGVRTLAFVRSRRGAEAVALTARRQLTEVAPELADKVAAYRAGYLPEDRRELERGLRSGDLLAMAATSALELGVDVSGLDAVLVAGWPGTRASLWQQVGRAGRRGQDALAVLVARDDPLDTYLVHHPGAVFGAPVETPVLDPANPYVLAPHLCAAAAELPLTGDDATLFGPGMTEVVRDLMARRLLRRRPAGWFYRGAERPSDLADLRGTGGEPFRLVEAETGRVIGTVDAGAAHHTVHDGAVYLHQGVTWVVERLDLVERVALLHRSATDVTTHAREATDIRILAESEHQTWGPVRLSLGSVEVSQQVVSYLVRSLATGEVLGELPLELPERRLTTTAVWWTVPGAPLSQAGLDPARVPGAAHAAEHASIGLLPLVATCDRWDVGGVSTALHPDTGQMTVFVHDGHPGGAGFSERGYRTAFRWLRATRDAVLACSCESGCPSCVQSPKCGNGNEPLDKPGAVSLLTLVLSGAPGADGAKPD